MFVFHRYIYKGENREIHFYRCPNSKLYINGHSSSTGKTSVTKSTKVCSNHFSAGKPTKQYPIPNLYLNGYLSNEISTKRKPPTARNKIPCKKRKSREFLKCLTPEEGNEVQNSPDKENKEPRTDFQDFSEILSLSSLNYSE